jgi:chitinase
MDTRWTRRILALGAALVAVVGMALVVAEGANAAGVTAAFAKTSDWGSGYQASITITNGGSSTISGWQVAFDLPSGTTVGTYWDALENTASGGHYVFANRDYNGSVAPGASVSFGFVASGDAAPTGCQVNGAACTGGGGSPSPTPTTASPSPTTSPTTPPNTGSARVAPYVDITYSSPTLVDIADATGQKTFTLAFVLASSAGCSPEWGGTIPLDDSRIIGEINALKAIGGQVIISSGGANGPYLESTCSSASALAAAYEQVVDATGAVGLDLDIEAGIPNDTVNQALAQLESARPGITVSYTLRVIADSYGLDPSAVAILQSAKNQGTRIDIVNPMTMDFSSSQEWGDAVIAAATNTLAQIKSVWPNDTAANLGVTPMIGKNDTGPVFSLADASKLVSWANGQHVGRLAFWSEGRDNGGCANGSVQPTCSGIAQSTWQFTGIFGGFTG